jgi:hypothetical protein
MGDRVTDEHREHVEPIEPVASGGGAHDVTGPEAAEHVGEPARTSPVSVHDDGTAAHADAHDDQPLGPIDWPAWRAAIIGIVVAAVIVALLYVGIR